MTKLTPMRTIRQKCLECSAGSTKEVRECPVSKYALYTFRFGRRPNALKKDTADDISEEKTAATAAVFDTERE